MRFPRLKWPDIAPPPPGSPPAPLWVRIGWMLALWGGSVLALFAIASVLRLVLRS